MALKQKLAELVVDITARLEPLKGQLAKAKGMLKRGFTSMVRIAKRAAIAIGVAFAASITWAVKLAMAAQESEALFSVAMGDMEDSTRKWSEQFAKSLRLNAFEVRKFVGTLNIMLKSMGSNAVEAAEMSQKMVELAFDISSMHDISPEAAFAKIRSGLVGMSRPLIELGYDLRETAVQEFAWKTGMVESGQQLTQTQKTLARYGLLLESTTIAQGDLKRTMGSATNVLRALKAQVVATAIRVGTKLLPQVTSIAEGMIDWVKSNSRLIASKIGDWVDALTDALKRLKPYLKFVADHPKAIIRTIGLMVAIPLAGWFMAGAKAAWTFGAAMLSASAGLLSLKAGSTAGMFIVPKSFRKLPRILKRASIALFDFRLQLKNVGKDAAKKLTFLFTKPVGAGKGVLLWLLTPLKVAYGLIGKLVIAIKGVTLAGLAGATATVAVLAGIVVGLVYITKRVVEWGKALYGVWKFRQMLKKQATFEQRAASAEATREDRALKRKRMLLRIEQKRRAEALKRTAVEEEAAAVSKESLQARLAFLEKIGQGEREIAKLKRKLLEIESEETAEAIDGDPLAIRLALTKKALALQKKADKEDEEKHRTEYRDRLQILKELFTDEAKFSKDLADIKKRLRYEEAADIQKIAPWMNLEAIKAMLKRKEAPVEIAKAGLTGLSAAWGQIATGTQRTQEEQLKALQGIRQSVERQEEMAETAGGMQFSGTPRH